MNGTEITEIILATSGLIGLLWTIGQEVRHKFKHEKINERLEKNDRTNRGTEENHGRDINSVN